MDLETEILKWDENSAVDISEIYERHKDAAGFREGLIRLISDTESQRGATWLLKRYLEENGQITALQIASIYQQLPTLEHWESRLNLLQSMPFMPVAETQQKTVEKFLRKNLVDDNKFVRAWSYNGFYELSVQYEEYRKEAAQFLEMALRDEAASVKARVRNILKKGYWEAISTAFDRIRLDPD